MEECAQKERIVSLETILSVVAETQREQKDISKDTLDKLTIIAVQGEQIKSLTSRTDKLEHDLEGMYKRVRKVEDQAIIVSSFMEIHRKADEEQSKISTPVKVGLIIAATVALVTFLVSMVDRHNYTQPPSLPASPGKPKRGDSV